MGKTLFGVKSPLTAASKDSASGKWRRPHQPRPHCAQTNAHPFAELLGTNTTDVADQGRCGVKANKVMANMFRQMPISQHG